MPSVLDGLRKLLTAARGAKADPAAAIQGDIAAIDRAINAAGVEAGKVEAQLAAAAGERERLLEAGADPAAMRLLAARVTELQDSKMALELFTRAQRRRRDELQAELREHRLAAAIGEVAPLVAKFLSAARAAHAAAGELAALVERSEALGLHEIRGLAEAAPWPFIDRLFFDQYETAVAQRLAAHQRPAALATTSALTPAAKPIAALPAPQPAGAAAAARKGRAGPVSANGAAPPAPKPPPKRATAPVAGFARMIVIRSGYTTDEGEQFAAGETIFVHPAKAAIAARNGALDYVKENPK